jgi:putative endopeptidase
MSKTRKSQKSTIGVKKTRNRKGRTKEIKHSKTISHNRNIICRNSYSKFEKDYSKSEKFLSKKKKLEKELISLFKRAPNQDKIRPQDDFYNYINSEWIIKQKVKEEQKYIVQVDSYRLVQDKVLKELKEIINDYLQHNNDNRATQLRNFSESITHKFGLSDFNRHIVNFITNLDDMRSDANNLWKFIGRINQHEFTAMGSPFIISLQQDEKDSKHFQMYVNSPRVSLIDTSVYYEDEATDDKDKKLYKASVKKHYYKYLNQISATLEQIDSSYHINPDDIFAIEKEILDTYMVVDNDIVEPLDSYNKITQQESMTKLGGFNWNELSKEYGFEKPPSFFLSYSLTYIKHMTRSLLTNWNSEKWRSYWIYIYAKYIIRFNAKTQMISFNFYGSYLKGMDKPVGTELLDVIFTTIAFNKFLSERYVQKFAIQEHLDYTRGFCEDLVEVFKRIVSRNTWLSPKTKKYALKKLEYMTLTIGTEPEILDDPDLTYSKTDFWENMTQIMLWRSKKKTLLQGKPIIDIPELDYSELPPKFVGKQSYIVNAMYTPAQNNIYIPLAYLQKPFIDLDERGIEYNLAHLGFTLCHEMSHSLDDLGSLYDHEGNLHDWWTPQDKTKFKKKQQDIIRQYEHVAALDGLKFDAEPSVGEDLADISGVAICQEYLRDFQDKNDDIPPIRKLSYLAFFVYFAFQQRQKISKKAIHAQLYTNPHPLDKYRTNVPLSRLELFRAIWNITKKDKMYWPSMDTVW